MRSAILAPFLASFLLLAGCSGGLGQQTDTSSTTASMTTDEQGNVVPIENETIPIETGEPVRIEQTLDLTVPDSYSATWDVKNGYRTFRVDVQLEGAQGTAPGLVASGIGYRLAGGTPVRTIEEQAPNDTSLTSGTPQSLVTFDGGAKDPNEMAGTWTFSMEWGPGAASATVYIEVQY